MNLKIVTLSLLFLSFLFSCGEDKTTNPASDNFPSVTIGSQVWMKRNLDVDHYRNGDPIPEVTDYDKWETLTTGAWCFYRNDPANGAIYGKLYNWYAVNDPRGLAPEGLHIPSYKEIRTLIDYLGGDSVAGGKLKERGTSHWDSPNAGATNSSGFTALPGAMVIPEWYYPGEHLGWHGHWWTSTEFPPIDNDSTWAYFMGLTYDSFHLGSSIGYNKHEGISVRCVRDK